MDTRKIEDLIVYDRNPRKNDEAVYRVLESLKRHGQVKAIVISAKGKPFENEIICCGHTTLKALKILGAKLVKVVVKEFNSESEFVDYNIRDNRSGEIAKWDFQELANITADFEDIDLNELGFNDNDLSELHDIEDDESDTDDDINKKSCPHCGKEL